jgi:hypothetical protein
VTGFRSLSEFYEETNEYERALITASLEAYAEEQQSAGRGGGGAPPGGPPGL